MYYNNSYEQSEFYDIKSCLDMKIDIKTLEIFLKEFYKDLLRRSDGELNDNKINKITFQESLLMPLIISERLFYSFTNNQFSNNITRDQFINGFCSLYSNDLQYRLDIISKVIDFDLDGVLSIDDLTMLLMHFYIIDNDMSSFNEIKNIIYKDLTPKKRITISSFKDIINNYNSDVFYLFCFFFNKFCPFTSQQVNYFKDIVKLKDIKVFSPISKNKESIKKFLGIPPTKTFIQFLQKNYNITIKEKSDNNALRKMKKSLSIQSENEELDELKDFENDIISTINYMENIDKVDNLEKKKLEKESTNTTNSSSIKNMPIIQNKWKNDMVLKSPPICYIPKSPFKNLNEYSKVKSYAKNNYNNTDIIVNYNNIDNYFEIKVNYYTRNGSIKDCKILMIDDCLYIHILGNKYKFLKIISLKFTFVEEIEQGETLSNHILRRVKLSSFLNSIYKEMIFSTESQIEMESFIYKLKHLIKNEELNKKYIKIKEIYRGSQSKIFLGKNTETNEQIVIKQIDQNYLDKNTRYETVLWERDIIFFLKKINHPNIVKVYDYFRTVDCFYFILEYIPNGNLKSFLLNNRKTLTENELKKIMLELSRAVLFLHSVGIIHRDLKPENVLIFKNDNGKIEVKLIDFGFSRILGKLDKLNEAYGTFSYASPEILNKKPYNFKTDIWSLGVIFYLVLFGIHPFGENEKNLKDINHNILIAKYKIPDNVDNKMKSLIEKCLNIEPKKRPKIEDVVKNLL